MALKSRFTIAAYIVSIAAIIPLGALFVIFNGILLSRSPLIFFVCFVAIFSYFFIWLLFSELRTKIITVEMYDDKIVRKNYLGFGSRKEISIDDIDGYVVSEISSKVRTYEYLFLISKRRKVIKISEFYHGNYKSLKSFILNNKIKFFGNEYFSYLRELKEIFV